ncbi:MAG: hypothetical protein ACRDYD_09880 [Acidimicrobiales bacterium]
MAWRDIWGARARSLLVVALVGLPVLFLAMIDVGYHTYNPTTAESYQRANGAAAAELTYAGSPLEQDPSGRDWNPVSAAGQADATMASQPTASDVARLLGAGSSVIVRREAAATVVSTAGLASVEMTGVDLSSPLARGLVTLTAGRLARHPGEAVVTPTLASQAGLHVGSTLRTIQPAGRYHVVGIADDPATTGGDRAWAMPGAVSGAAGTGTTVDFLAGTAEAVTWPAVLRLNAAGYAVQSRWVTAHPPPASQVRFSQGFGSHVSKGFVASGALVGGLGLLEVVLLAGPAFAVMARRQERALALVATAGGRRRDLRDTVLANGIILGALAGLAATGIGVGAAWLAEPLLAHLVHTRPGPLGVRPADLALVALVGVVTALAAVAMPARAAARTDVVAALASRRPRPRARLRVPVIAAAIAALGVVVALAGATRHGATALVLAGVALVEVGVVVATPTILLLATSLGRHLPLAPRLALRDAGRNRSSAAPAAAAVMAAVIGCVAVLVTVSSVSATDLRTYRPTMPRGDVSVGILNLTSQSSNGPSEVAAALRSTLATSSVAVVSTPGRCSGAAGCALTVVPHVAPGLTRTTRFGSTTSFGGGLGYTIVASAAALPALTGLANAAGLAPAVAALHAGEALLADAWAVHDGRAALDVVTYPPAKGAGPPPEPTLRTVEVPATVLRSGFAPAEVILPPALARRIGAGSTPTAVVAATTTAPTTAQTQALRAALVKVDVAHPGLLDPSQLFSVASGYRQPGRLTMLALILATAIVAVAAAGIATGLNNLDRSDDLRTLEAIGAGPRVRRVLSSARAGVVAGLGAVLGTLAGFVPALAWIISRNQSIGTPATVQASPAPGSLLGNIVTTQVSAAVHLVVPWAELAAVVVGIPLAACLLAGLLSRSHLPASTGRTA